MGLALKLERVLWTPFPNTEAPVVRVFSGARRVNEAGVALIKAFEGTRLKAYHDAVGYPTQGTGRLLSRIKWEDLSKYPDISDELATIWLNQDLDKYSRGVARLIPYPLNDNEFAALTSFAFNLGLGALEASTLRRRLLRGEPSGIVAREEFPRWNKAGGRVLAGLTRRRLAERDLFLAGR